MQKARCGCRKRGVAAESEVWLQKARCRCKKRSVAAESEVWMRGVDAESEVWMQKARCGCRKRSVDAESEVWLQKARCRGVDVGTLTFLLAISAAAEAKFSPSGVGMR